MKKKFNVDGMTCAACQSHVEKAVKQVNGIKKVNVNLLNNTMDVEYEESICTINMIQDSVKNAGYEAYLPNSKKKKKDASLIHLILSFVFLILLMYFSMGVMMWGFWTPEIFDMEKCPMGFSLIQFILVLPILILQRRYFIVGFKRLFKNPSMDSLIAVGASMSMAYSIYCLFQIAYDPKDTSMYHMCLYFEAAGMILCFVSLGKYLEEISKGKTKKDLEALFQLKPKTAILVNDKEEILIDIDQVKKGDILLVKKGNMVPVDGIIIDGSGSFDESNITGESLPIYKKKKDHLYQSTILKSGVVYLKAENVGNDTSFSTILRLVEEASYSKAPISKLADKISSIFVPLIFILSVLVFLGNFLYIRFSDLSYVKNAFEVAFNYAVTVIVIACPCALGLATPVAIMVSTGMGAKNGLIIKNAEILEQTGKIDTVVLDKTGTITKGHPVVTDCTIDSEYMDMFYSLEMNSEHPLAEAVCQYALSKGSKRIPIKDFMSLDGKGVIGMVNGKKIFLGNTKDNTFQVDVSEFEEMGKTVLYATVDEKFVGIMAIRDEIKDNSKKAIEYLSNMNIDVIMLTGDNERTANAIAKELNIGKVYAEVNPLDKGNIIEKLEEEGRIVSMVGDGVNDALALTKANLGIALGQGSDAACESSDIVLVRNDLLDVVNAIRLSKRTLFTIKLGLFWAFFYNIICIFLASGILFHITKGSFIMKPEYGSIAMSISSVSVVLNALTIYLFKMVGIKKKEVSMATIVIGVDGMMCKHCKAHVEEACKSILGVTEAVASLEDKNVTVTCDASVTKETLEKSIFDAGYDIR